MTEYEEEQVDALWDAICFWRQMTILFAGSSAALLVMIVIILCVER